ncbi:ABC transporter permease subunit [Actinomadura rudentiformis]|uniref:ABC transporter permease subunit n=1 Tax=Actinomadura rudentiformis TaxID=359158 RepID=A0A6H9YNJ3_9ACTN|nr:ABC transporter permease subunit [Actinomadura rudentiformis]KAB2349041.1 ABC transporter permease subunit [Actinomadura rudentiformis]
MANLTGLRARGDHNGDRENDGDRGGNGGAHGRGGGAVGGGLPGAVAAEWTKLWSLRSTWWALFAAFGVMGLMSAILATSTASNNTNAITTDDQGVVQVSGIAVGATDLVQFVLIALAILMITGEYATGSIRTTLQWVPLRDRMLAAKAAVTAAVMLPAGVALGVLGTAVAEPLLGRWGRLSAGDAVADVLAVGVYLALTCVFILGVGTVLRSTAGALTTAFLLLMAVPMLLVNSSVKALGYVADALPSTAGRHFMAGEGGPYPPAVGLLILAAWAVASLALGTVVLRRRDA